MPDSETASSRVLPVFPLGSVLVPGLVMPLHIFEPRYRRLVQDLLAKDEEEREFVVVAIREGHDVGVNGVDAFHSVGTVASVREVDPHDDGRYDIVAVGTDRVAIEQVITDLPCLQARTSIVLEHPGEAAEIVAAQVRRTFAVYRGALSGEEDPDATDFADDLPEDPGVLSYLVAAAIVAEVLDKQEFLEIPDDAQRLRSELRRLRQEIAIMSALPSLPAVDLRTATPSPN